MDRVLSIAEALTCALKAGFVGEQAVTMVAIAMAESKLHTQAPDYINTGQLPNPVERDGLVPTLPLNQGIRERDINQERTLDRWAG